MWDYAVIEDNGGGLHLFVFQLGGNVPVYAFEGFEYSPGSLIVTLDGLDNGEDPSGWDGRVDDPQASWEYILTYNFGYETICYKMEDYKRVLNPDRMGRAGQLEFGIESE